MTPKHPPHSMTRSIHRLCAVMMAAISLASLNDSSAADLEPAPITAALKRSADWQLANPSGTEIRDWIIAPLYDGLLRTALTTGDAKYLAAVIRFGTQSGWTPSNRVYHADDHAVGHAWLPTAAARGATLALMDRGGHFCPVAEAGEYNRIVLGFLQES